jgi:hypothetical protein
LGDDGLDENGEGFRLLPHSLKGHEIKSSKSMGFNDFLTISWYIVIIKGGERPRPPTGDTTMARNRRREADRRDAEHHLNIILATAEALADNNIDGFATMEYMIDLVRLRFAADTNWFKPFSALYEDLMMAIEPQYQDNMLGHYRVVKGYHG